LWRRLIAALGVRAGWLQWRGGHEPPGGGPGRGRPPPPAGGGRGGRGAPPAGGPPAGVLLAAGGRPGGRPPPRVGGARGGAGAAAARELLGEHLRLPADASPAERDAKAAVDAALEALSGFDRLGAPCGWDDFLDAFERALARAQRPVGAGTLGVRALDAMDAR